MATPSQQGDADPVAHLRTMVDQRLVETRNERSSYLTTWRDLSYYVLPNRGRYWAMPNQGNRGTPKNQKILDRTASVAVQNLAAFLMAGITSPARDWFRLQTNDDTLNEDDQVKTWCAEVQSRMMRVLAAGNFYNSIQQVYEEISTFGTGPMIIMDDYEDVVRFYPLTAGEFMLATNERQEVDTLIREYVQTVKQLVAKFGRENCSPSVQILFDSNQLGREVPVVHAILPNPTIKRRALGWQSYPYVSVYYEYGNRTLPTLKVEGFKEKPFVAPRWHVISNDVYGHGPAEDALPDTKSLQVAQRRYAEAVDKAVNPPTMADSSLQQGLISLLPGGMNFVPGLGQMGPGAGIRPVYQVQLDKGPLLERIQDFRQAIKTTLKNDLILMVSQMDQAQPVTAAEINVRQEEKLLALGPVLERFHNEALNPIITVTMARMERAGLLPPRPQSMKSAYVQANYISVLAQAQKAAQTAGIEQLYRFAGGLIGVDPTVMDSFDFDFTVRDYGELIGVDQRNYNDKDKVAAIKAQRLKDQQQQQGAQYAMAAAQGAKNLSDADVGGGQNALQAITQGTQ
jgi:hypothetical protein